MTGIVYGVGLGPGEPDLMSAKALKLLASARHVAFFRKKGRAGRARTLASDLIPADAVEFAMEYPLTTEVPLEDPRYNRSLAEFYDGCTAHLTSIVEDDEDVVVLCEGDPFFYGSFMHLHERLNTRVPVEVVPGIPGMAAAWTASGMPIAWGDDVLTVLMGTLEEDVLVKHMEAADALVVMKVGRNLPKVRVALERTGRAQDAWMIECATMADQKITRLADVSEGHVPPYFTIVLVHGQGRRP